VLFAVDGNVIRGIGLVFQGIGAPHSLAASRITSAPRQTRALGWPESSATILNRQPSRSGLCLIR
jgi:hypothetical protein